MRLFLLYRSSWDNNDEHVWDLIGVFTDDSLLSEYKNSVLYQIREIKANTIIEDY